MLEASRALAAQMVALQPRDPLRLDSSLERVLSRQRRLSRRAACSSANWTAPSPTTASHPEDAAKLLAIGQTAPGRRLHAAELAAHTVVASLVLNLDEAITHE